MGCAFEERYLVLCKKASSRIWSISEQLLAVLCERGGQRPLVKSAVDDLRERMCGIGEHLLVFVV